MPGRVRRSLTPADRDFTLTYAAKPGAAPSVSLLKQTKNGSDYLLALVVPPTMNRDFAPKPRETIFVLRSEERL